MCRVDEIHRLEHRILRRPEEASELHEIEAVLAAVVIVVTADPSRAIGGGTLLHHTARRMRVARLARERRTDESFQSLFGCVSGHQIRSFSRKDRIPNSMPSIVR